MDGPIKNYSRFYSSWHRLSHRDEAGEKDAIVSQYTGGRTTRLSEMRAGEYKDLCKALDNMLGYGDQRKRQRSIALHLMQELGIDTKDWQRINDFCQNPRICGKVFALLDIGELEALQKKLRAIKRRGGLRSPESEEGRGKSEESKCSSNDIHQQQLILMDYGNNNTKPS